MTKSSYKGQRTTPILEQVAAGSRSKATAAPDKEVAVQVAPLAIGTAAKRRATRMGQLGLAVLFGSLALSTRNSGAESALSLRPSTRAPDGPQGQETPRIAQAPPEPPLIETAPELPERTVRDVSIAISTPNELTPEDIAAKKFDRLPLVLEGPGWQRSWMASEFFWTAPAVGYRPLYFEDANLERYGHSFGALQPAVSAGRGFGQFLALPYQMTLQPPWEVVYPLGYARPGDRVMYQAERLEWDARAAAVEAGVATGFVFLIP